MQLITWIFTRQPKELYSKESAASQNRTLLGRVLNRSGRLIDSYRVRNFGHVSIEVD